ncbi:MAG: hypothetical protein KF721_15235 [Ignavibacteriaceae bacterium]|nr:hypothetical protein [Ignavibacteriaceae bacterium]
MSYNIHCDLCPYFNQLHLEGNIFSTNRNSPPIILENNSSSMLLVFQSPGIKEWEEGIAIFPERKKGGSAGRRIELSWIRKQKQRSEYDIINVVQCFPGRVGIRDNFPSISAICSCKNRLKDVLENSNYVKIIAFGTLAIDVTKSILREINKNVPLVESVHPNGGITNEELDRLW